MLRVTVLATVHLITLSLAMPSGPYWNLRFEAANRSMKAMSSGTMPVYDADCTVVYTTVDVTATEVSAVPTSTESWDGADVSFAASTTASSQASFFPSSGANSVTEPSATSSAASSAAFSATPSATRASTKSSAAPSESRSGAKRGLAIGGDEQDSLIAAFNNVNSINWVNNWYSAPPDNLSSHIEFVPQMYGKLSNVDGEWTRNADKAERDGAKYFLSFGEVNTPNDDLYMDAPTAADFWMKEMQEYAQAGVSVSTPPVLFNTGDLEYLSKFINVCEGLGCDMGFVCVHWIWEADQTDSFKDSVSQAIKIANGRKV